MTETSRPQPLAGLRVVDLGHALAGPFAAALLGDFGAEVIKIERRGNGDAMRQLGPRKNGISLWWKVAARNKKSVTLDFTTERGREVLLDLVRASDVVVENFRPGTLERHKLGWEDMREANPRLVMLRISGYGQTGPYSTRGGFGRVAEAMSGASHLTGEAGGPPIHAGYSLADNATGLMGAFGVLLLLIERVNSKEGGCIDLALYEPLHKLIDWQIPVYDQLKVVGRRAGNQFPDAVEGVTAGVDQTSDGKWLCYSAATDAIKERLVRLVLGEEGLSDPRFDDPEQRRANAPLLQAEVAAWISKRTAEEVEETFERIGAVIGQVYDAEQIWNDPCYRDRENIVRVADEDLGELAMASVVPRIVGQPVGVDWAGPALGAHTESVLEDLLGISAAEAEQLREQGVI